MSASSRKKGHAANGSGKTRSTKAHHSNKQSKPAVQQQQQQQQQQKLHSSRGPAKLCQAGSERGLLESIGRLLTLFIKGFAALLLFTLIFNLALVVLNAVVFKGRISQYIPAKSWRDILGH